MWVKKQQLDPGMELAGSGLRKEHDKAAYFTLLFNLCAECVTWNAGLNELQVLESRLLGEISTTSDMAGDTTLMAESEEELKSLLMRVKEESEKAGLKLKNLRWWHLVPSSYGK